MNLYAYTYNDPLNYVDSTGQAGEFVALRLVLVTAGADAVTPDPTDAGAPVKAAGYAGAIIGTAIGGSIVWVANNLSNESSDSDNSEKKESKKERRKRQKQERKDRKANEPASEDRAKWIGRETEKKYGKEKRREGHDAKQKGEPDRSAKQLEEDNTF